MRGWPPYRRRSPPGTRPSSRSRSSCSTRCCRSRAGNGRRARLCRARSARRTRRRAAAGAPGKPHRASVSTSPRCTRSRWRLRLRSRRTGRIPEVSRRCLAHIRRHCHSRALAPGSSDRRRHRRKRWVLAPPTFRARAGLPSVETLPSSPARPPHALIATQTSIDPAMLETSPCRTPFSSLSTDDPPGRITG
jgi:hypothetical protein